MGKIDDLIELNKEYNKIEEMDSGWNPKRVDKELNDIEKKIDVNNEEIRILTMGLEEEWGDIIEINLPSRRTY